MAKRRGMSGMQLDAIPFVDTLAFSPSQTEHAAPKFGAFRLKPNPEYFCFVWIVSDLSENVAPWYTM